MSASKPWFLGQPAPPNYIAGLGRGATGFTTRSDIGPARSMEPGMGGAGVAGSLLGKRMRDGDNVDDDDAMREATGRNVDEGAMFTSAPYEADDKAADEVWSAVDRRMDSKRRKRREERERKEIEEYRKSRPKISQTFADVTAQLDTVSAEEWNAIPDIGDYSVKHKKKDTFTPAPDSLLEKARQESQYAAALNAEQQQFGGIQAGLGAQTPLTPVRDLTQMGEAKKAVLSLKLQGKSESVAGQTVVNATSYIDDLSKVTITSDAEVGDLKRARLLLESVVTTNPTHAPGWIAAARLEEVGGKIAQARKLITKACEHCGDSESVWLESARLHPPEGAKVILARAVQRIPTSVNIWMKAAALEQDTKMKKKVLRRALEYVPSSVKLWKAAVELETPEAARVLLARAVECIPHSVEMWLALVRLETYERARAVLNQARQAIPTEHSIWITAAKLEEANGNSAMVGKIMKKGIRNLAKHQVTLSREQWLEEAVLAEKSNAPETCAAIVQHTIGMGLEDDDRLVTWREDAQKLLEQNAVQTARAVFATILSVYPGKKQVWFENALLEKQHGTAESLELLLKKAVAYCPQAEVLWLMAAKEKWLNGDVAGSRTILKEAFKANPNSEQIWLAAVKLEHENNEPVRARSLLDRARQMAGTARVWMKSAKLERELNQTEREKELLDGGLELYPAYDKLWLMRAQLAERLDDVDDARDVYKRGLLQCPTSIPLWLCSVRFEERIGAVSAARARLEKARMRNPQCPQLWLEAVRIEKRSGEAGMASAMLAKALRECPRSGVLWAEAIAMEPRPKQKTKAVTALRKVDDDAHVMVAVAKVFWNNRRIDKARNWFNRAVALDADLGDAWAAFYKFELQHGGEEEQKKVMERCIAADPVHGELWTSVSKDIVNARLKTAELLPLVAALVVS